jgi:hypothetical protein
LREGFEYRRAAIGGDPRSEDNERIREEERACG